MALYKFYKNANLAIRLHSPIGTTEPAKENQKPICEKSKNHPFCHSEMIRQLAKIEESLQ